jgi:hypothetical protein
MPARRRDFRGGEFPRARLSMHIFSRRVDIMQRILLASVGIAAFACSAVLRAEDAKPPKKYFGHAVVEDRHGVIAPWYKGQNGQCDFRLRISQETLKRYPWTEPGKSAALGPHCIYNGFWNIKPDGEITIDYKLKDWDNGDVGQRTFGLLLSQVDYYRYSGDPSAIGIIEMTADNVLDNCLTSDDHPWPRFFISCPTKGKAYYKADPHGFIQIDISAHVGTGMIGAYKITGDERYWEIAKHWADLFAERCNPKPGDSPWPRYANPEDVPPNGVLGAWGSANVQTGGVALILRFLDEMIRTGYTGKNDSLVKARDAGEKYLRDVLLPKWNSDPTFGCYYWDWDNPTYTFAVAGFVSQYMMSRPEAFPNWKTDVRNIMSLNFCRTSVNPESLGDVYSGAWAFPESSSCCLTSLQYPITATAAVFAQYAASTGDPWAREIARRQVTLWTYDMHETGVVEDLIGGGVYVAAIWFNCGHTWPFRCLLEHMSWQPELLGASRENHLMRTSSVVTDVRYEKGIIAYKTFDANAPCEDVLRLAFAPKSISADGKTLPQRESLSENGYSVKPLPNGDCIVTVRRDGLKSVLVEGDDPQEAAESDRLRYEGDWSIQNSTGASDGKLHVAESAGAAASFEFEGNQVRLIGRADPEGGRADVYLDGVKQLCGIDFWCPQARDGQVLCIKNGLAQGKHTLKIVVSGTKNPLGKGTKVYVDAIQWSAAQGEAGLGEASGPADAQRVIFGYTRRKDYVDSQGRDWRPAAEYIMRIAGLADLEPIAMWTEPKVNEVADTKDAELYRYGVHGKDFTAYFTVDPKRTYYARIKLCQADEPESPGKLATSIDLQGKSVAADVDVAATAGGLNKPADLVFNGIEPKNGVIVIRFWNRHGGEAMVQAVEIGPGSSEPGAKPVQASVPPKQP